MRTVSLLIIFLTRTFREGAITTAENKDAVSQVCYAAANLGHHQANDVVTNAYGPHFEEGGGSN